MLFFQACSIIFDEKDENILHRFQVGVSIMFLLGCNREDTPIYPLPVLATGGLTHTSFSSIKVDVTIISEGDSPVTEKVVCRVTESSTDKALAYNMIASRWKVTENAELKGSGFSLRCIKD